MYSSHDIALRVGWPTTFFFFLIKHVINFIPIKTPKKISHNSTDFIQKYFFLFVEYSNKNCFTIKKEKNNNRFSTRRTLQIRI